MKTLFIFLLGLGFAFGQEIRFEEVVKVDSLISKTTLFTNSKIWVNNIYNSGKEVIQMDDKDAGIIVGKATIKYAPTFFIGSDPAYGYIDYNFKISVKDGRYKYEFYDFTHKSTNIGITNGTLGLLNVGEKYTGSNKIFSKNYRNKVNEDCYKLINNTLNRLITSLKNSMNINQIKKEENW